MKKKLSFFEQILFEAPGDAPDMPGDSAPLDTGDPPDMPDDNLSAGGDVGGDMPDIPGDDTSGGDDSFDSGMDAFGSDGSGDENKDENNLEVDEKISNILNKLLYDKFLTLLTQIGSQLSNIKNNNEILHSLAPNVSEITEELKRLDESIRLYINNSFINENSSKNLLFFNQCLNALKLLNEKFSHEISKGIHQSK